MKVTIRNKDYALSAVTRGAEITGFEDTRDGYEYIWQKCDIWQGQSPLLFPIVGKLKDDKLILDKGEYVMPKHGFGQTGEYALESITEDSMTFLLTDSPETRACYPFAFELRVTYRLLENGFTMNYSVKNTGDGEMYFSLGAHPGFNIALGDRVVMERPETVKAWQFGPDMLIKSEQTDVFHGGDSFAVGRDTFARDAFVFEGLSSSGCTVTKRDGRNVHVDFGGAPCVGMWAKPAARYVCIEPWHGMDDRWDAQGGFAEKKYVEKLPQGEEFRFTVTVSV